jgi:hypothetical protein
MVTGTISTATVSDQQPVEQPRETGGEAAPGAAGRHHLVPLILV